MYTFLQKRRAETLTQAKKKKEKTLAAHDRYKKRHNNTKNPERSDATLKKKGQEKDGNTRELKHALQPAKQISYCIFYFFKAEKVAHKGEKKKKKKTG